MQNRTDLASRTNLGEEHIFLHLASQKHVVIALVAIVSLTVRIHVAILMALKDSLGACTVLCFDRHARSLWKRSALVRATHKHNQGIPPSPRMVDRFQFRNIYNIMR